MNAFVAAVLSPLASPSFTLQLKILPCENCCLAFPSRVSLPLKHSLSPFPGGRKSSTMGMQISITSRPTFYPGFFYGVKLGFVSSCLKSRV